MPLLYIRLIVVTIVLALIGGAYGYVKHLQSNLAEARAEIVVLDGKFKTSQEDLAKATEAALTLDTQRKVADEARAAVQKERDVALSKLKNQKPPVDCKAAIQWSVDSKGDLSW
jgi:predicted Holliday junction resolvase-like endonuclease